MAKRREEEEGKGLRGCADPSCFLMGTHCLLPCFFLLPLCHLVPADSIEIVEPNPRSISMWSESGDIWSSKWLPCSIVEVRVGALRKQEMVNAAWLGKILKKNGELRLPSSACCVSTLVCESLGSRGVCCS